MTAERGADARDYDTTSLRLKDHGVRLHRDYSAHFWRWNWVRRFTQKHNRDNSCRILDIGCGVDRALPKLLTVLKQTRPAYYLGADLNKIGRPGNIAWEDYLPEFNFVERWHELTQAGNNLDLKREGPLEFDLAVHLEVIEHMQPDHGQEMLRGIFELLVPGGHMIMSTPVYNGRQQAANHIHEYYVDELRDVVEKVGFVVERRFGTFGNVPTLRKLVARQHPERLAVYDELAEYFDNDAMSCIFAPLFPDHARNNLWVCRKPEAK